MLTLDVANKFPISYNISTDSAQPLLFIFIFPNNHKLNYTNKAGIRSKGQCTWLLVGVASRHSVNLFRIFCVCLFDFMHEIITVKWYSVGDHIALRSPFVHINNENSRVQICIGYILAWLAVTTKTAFKRFAHHNPGRNQCLHLLLHPVQST